jgi:hypothetical protein
VQPAEAQSEVPVVVGGNPEVNACDATGIVRGLDPAGDGFLSVRLGPSKTYAETDRLYEGDVVFICSLHGDWYAVVYPADGRVDCGVSTPLPEPVTYSGRCQAGWVHRAWIVGLAG